MLLLSYLEQTECAQALVKMRLPKTPVEFWCLEDEDRKDAARVLLQSPKAQAATAFLPHQRSARAEKSRYTTPSASAVNCFVIRDCPAGYRSPIDVTLRFAVDVGAHSCKIVAFSKLRQWPAVVPASRNLTEAAPRPPVWDKQCSFEKTQISSRNE